MQLLVEFGHMFHRSIPFQPGIASISHNLEKPGARGSPMESAEEAVGAEHRLLRDIFRILAAPKQPARKVKGGVEVGQNELLEARPLVDIQHVRASPLVRPTHWTQTACRRILFPIDSIE